MLAAYLAAAAYSPQARPACSPHGQHARARPATLSEVVATAPDTAFAAKKAALIAGLKREYSSFFSPMEMELYDPDVSFNDPLVSFTGTSAFKANVDMLSGGSAVGKLLFDDCGLVNPHPSPSPNANPTPNPNANANPNPNPNPDLELHAVGLEREGESG